MNTAQLIFVPLWKLGKHPHPKTQRAPTLPGGSVTSWSGWRGHFMSFLMLDVEIKFNNFNILYIYYTGLNQIAQPTQQTCWCLLRFNNSLGRTAWGDLTTLNSHRRPRRFLVFAWRQIRAACSDTRAFALPVPMKQVDHENREHWHIEKKSLVFFKKWHWFDVGFVCGRTYSVLQKI